MPIDKISLSTRHRFRLLLLASGGLLVLPVLARPDLSGGVTTTYQSSNDQRSDAELTTSADLLLNWDFDANVFYIYIEANNSPKNNGVSSVLPEANADAGSALDKDREGRVQISEVGYRHTLNDASTLTLGLIDVTAYFDQSRIASDENTQFMGVSFVQNPTIEFPDYTLGVVYENTLNENMVLRAGMASSNGIADNPNLSYAQLVDINSDEKGVFSVVSLTYKTPTWLMRGGAWSNTADHDALDGVRLNEHNYGAYMLAGYRENNHGINLRLGHSNAAVSLVHQFVGLSYQYRQPPYVLGAGAAKILMSEQSLLVADNDTTHYEVYFRYKVQPQLFITLDVQQLINSNFDTTDTSRDHRQQLYGLRLSYVVE